jgi:hypothetical protein
MDLECFPLPGLPLSMSHRQTFYVRDQGNVTVQDQSQRKNAAIFILVRALRRVITLCLVLLYYVVVLANEFDAPDRLQAATYIV